MACRFEVHTTTTITTRLSELTPLWRVAEAAIHRRPFQVEKMAYNEDSSASGHDEPWIQWYEERLDAIRFDFDYTVEYTHLVNMLSYPKVLRSQGE